MAFHINGSNPFHVDMSELHDKIELMHGCLTEDRYRQMLYSSFKDVARRAKNIIAKDVTEDYAVTQQWAKAGIGHYKLNFGGMFPVTCTIPLEGRKGVIGPTFKLRQTSKYYGRKIKGVAKRPQKPQIFAQIIKGEGASRLPDTMQRQGGNAPFIVKGMVFTRRTKKSKQIVRVVALGLPQMPLNRSGEDIQDDLLAFTSERLDHNFARMLGGKR